jgi:hypothetical protein
LCHFRPAAETALWWVELHGNVYSFDELPNPESKLVKYCIENFHENGLTDIGGLDEPFKEVGRLLEIAYYEAVAKDMHALERKVTDLCFDTTALCNKSCNILSNYSMRSEYACIQFKAAFCYLRDGLENIAYAQLKTIKTSQLDASFEELTPLLDKCSSGVKDLLNWVSEEKEKLGRAEEERQTCERDVKAARGDRLHIEEQLAAEGKELAGMKKHSTFTQGVEVVLETGVLIAQTARLFALPIPATMINGVVCILNAGQRIVKSAKTKDEDMLRLKKHQAELEGAHFEANKKLIKLADGLEMAREKEQVLTGFQPLLQELAAKLKIVRQKLLTACSFWQRLQTVISPVMDTEHLQASVDALPPTEQERAKFWQSKAFAEDAISLYTR